MCGEKGFTLIELLLVIAILGIVAAIGVGEFFNNRKQAYDRQTIVKAREWMTLATVAVANQELDLIAGGTSFGTPGEFPTLDMNPTIKWSYGIAAGDVWQFYLASAGGKTAYYFWIPGPSCAVNVDGSGLSSDQIFDNEAWRAAPLIL
jgi:prepilin-type N-terminal cleavage/methylation domain-containing protein